MEKQRYLQIGEVVGTHGVVGEMRVQPWSDTPAAFCTLSTLYGDPDGREKLKVKSRPHKRIALMKVDGVQTVQDAALWRGRVLYADRRDMKLPAGRHFIQDLLGLPIVDADTGEEYGVLAAVSNTGANDIYTMRTPDGREVLIPVIPAIVLSADPDKGRILIRPMEGLFE